MHDRGVEARVGQALTQPVGDRGLACTPHAFDGHQHTTARRQGRFGCEQRGDVTGHVDHPTATRAAGWRGDNRAGPLGRPAPAAGR